MKSTAWVKRLHFLGQEVVLPRSRVLPESRLYFLCQEFFLGRGCISCVKRLFFLGQEVVLPGSRGCTSKVKITSWFEVVLPVSRCSLYGIGDLTVDYT